MADISANLYQWSATAGNNNPSGTTTIGTGLDDNLRQIQATVRQDLANKGSDIASATTTDLGAVIGLMHDITGTTTITGFGTVSAGIWKIIKFEGALTLTHNGTSLILPGAANITTVAGDVGIFMSEGSGNWRCLSWLPTSNAGAGALTAGRVPIVGTAGKLTDDADFTFDTQTLTVHTLTVSTGVTTLAAGELILKGYGGEANAGLIRLSNAGTTYIYYNATSVFHRVAGTDRLTLTTAGADVTGTLGVTGDLTASASLLMGGRLFLAAYAVAGIPSASPSGGMIYVNNEAGGAVPAFSDGTNWRRVTDRAVVS